MDSHVASYIDPPLTDHKVNGAVDQAEYSHAHVGRWPRSS